MVRRADELFTPGDREAIAEVIAEAERETSGEIVPVVAASSGRYDRAEDLVGLTVAVATLAAVWLGFQRVDPGEWTAGHDVRVGLPLLLLAGVAGVSGGLALAVRFPALAAPVVSRREMNEEVERAALAAFQRFRVHRTARAAGVLIYVSLRERRVRVLGDEAVSEIFTQYDWEGVRDAMLAGLYAGQPAAGLCGAIRAAGRRLAEHFPASEGDRNELGNELRIL